MTKTWPTGTWPIKPMTDQRNIDDQDEARRRTAARRTAIGLAVSAVLLYLMFIMSGVFGTQ